MSTPCDWQRFAGRRLLRAAVVFLSLGVSGAMFSAAAAAPQPATNPPASAEERTSLRQGLESRYEVLPVRDGIVLKPRQPRAGVHAVEVTSDGVAVDRERANAPPPAGTPGGAPALAPPPAGVRTAAEGKSFCLL